MSGGASIAMMAMAAAGALSAMKQGEAQSDALKSQAQAQQYNAAVAENNAQTAEAQGNANEEAQRRKARMVMGAQRAGIAESGIGNEGTGSDLVQQSAANAEMDALNIRYGAQLQAVGFRNNAKLDNYQADDLKSQAKSAITASYLNAGAAVLSGTGKYMSGQASVANANAGVK